MKANAVLSAAGVPSVELCERDEPCGYLSPAEARQLAEQLVEQATQAESAALLHSFWQKLLFPPEALKYMLTTFRDHCTEHSARDRSIRIDSKREQA